MNKQERLQEVYRYLVFSHNVEKQKDLAKALNRNENNISRALKGDPKCLTDRFFKAIAARYPFISLGWLLTGEGNMLNKDETQPTPAATNSTFISITGLPARIKDAIPKANAKMATPARMVFLRPILEAMIPAGI